ncbi:Phenoloxidase subunit 1 [Melipona quadrifasciata]|uniref:Phenoloxidase subunit 1 n=1 Tax=Melipona quadrifasciata TaxID=166423 RepID=A0A0M9A8N0_9HYME|nr:Phenoloxidase subunit 1 [Melipona quadrifasciata]
MSQVEQAEPTGCKDAVSYCGLRDRKYPDARAMGYPFDRQPRAGVENLAQFLTGNMAVTEITVRFSDTVVPKSRSGGIGNSLTFIYLEDAIEKLKSPLSISNGVDQHCFREARVIVRVHGLDGIRYH